MRESGTVFSVILSVLIILGLAIAPVSAAADEAVISRVDLGTLGGASSYATDLNNAGTVVGWSQTAAGIDRAFRWTAGTAGMEDLGTLPGDEWSRAFRNLDNGRILGVSGASRDIYDTPVLWSRHGSVAALPYSLLLKASYGHPRVFNEPEYVRS